MAYMFRKFSHGSISIHVMHFKMLENQCDHNNIVEDHLPINPHINYQFKNYSRKSYLFHCFNNRWSLSEFTMSEWFLWITCVLLHVRLLIQIFTIKQLIFFIVSATVDPCQSHPCVNGISESHVFDYSWVFTSKSLL